MENTMHVLRNLGISPENLSFEQLESISEIGDELAQTNKVTEKMTKTISNMMQIEVKPKAKPKIVQERIGRNDRCNCGSGRKQKNCCLSKKE